MKSLLVVQSLFLFLLLSSVYATDMAHSPVFYECVAERDKVVGAVRTGIVLYRAKDLVEKGAPGNYPGKLDKARNRKAGSRNKFFTIVLKDGVIDPMWSKKKLIYTATCDDVEYSYRYDRKTGTFSPANF